MRCYGWPWCQWPWKSEPIDGDGRSIVLGPYFYFPPFSEQFSPNALAAIFATFLRQIHFPPFLPPAMHFKLGVFQAKQKRKQKSRGRPPAPTMAAAGCMLPPLSYERDQLCYHLIETS